jgi:hypothetical protein
LIALFSFRHLVRDGERASEEGSQMKIRKILLLGCAAAAALALAAPAPASAAEWQHEGAPLEEHAEAALGGSEIFVTAAGGMICEVDATLTIVLSDTAQIANYAATKCLGLFGELAGCTVVAAEQTEGPWAAYLTAADLDVGAVTLTRTLDPECPVKKIESHIPELTMTPIEPEAITELEYFGSGEASIDGGPVGEYESFGSFFVNPAGTYGIG